MFDDPEITWNDRPALPEAVTKRPHSFERCAIELYGLPPDWQFIRLTAKGDQENGYTEVEGGVYRTRFEKGKRKGEINHDKPEPGTHMTVAIPLKHWREWTARWERDTGCCSGCYGTGKASAGWSAGKGAAFRPCKKCNATGIAKVEVAA